MTRSIWLLFILLTSITAVNVASADSHSGAIVVVEKHRFVWKVGGGNYEVVSTIPKGWNDAGEYTELAFRTPDGKQLVLAGLAGIPQSDIPLAAKPNGLNSRYLLLTPRAAIDKDSFLLLREYAFASSPGYVSVLALNDKGFPEFVFREELNVEKLVDYDSDGRVDILIRGGVGEPWGGGESYDPYLVYTQKYIDGHLKFKVNENLSRKWSSENRYPWVGLRYSEKHLVTREPAGTKIRKVERTEHDSATASPTDSLIKYHVDHTHQNGIRHALIDNYDNLKRLKQLDKNELNIVKNAIFARRGYVFGRKDLQDYFERQAWYKRSVNLSAGDAVETDGVDKAILAIIELIEAGSNWNIIEQLESLLRTEKRTDTEWKELNLTRIPAIRRDRAKSLGDLHIGDEFFRIELEKRFGRIMWSYQAMHQAGEFGGKNKGYTANLYLFKGIGIRTQNDGQGERIYAIHAGSGSHKTNDGVTVETKMSEVQEKIPWMWIEDKENGLLLFEGCNHYSISFKRRFVDSILLRGCDRFRP